MLDIMEIQKRLPHRYPFLLVDRVLELEPKKRAVAIKNVTMNEQFFTGHYPGRPVMPGVLIVEAMAQVGGLTMIDGDELDSITPFFVGIDNVKFRQPVVPGDQLRLEVEITKARSNMVKFTGKALVDGKLVAEGELTCAIVKEN